MKCDNLNWTELSTRRHSRRIYTTLCMYVSTLMNILKYIYVHIFVSYILNFQSYFFDKKVLFIVRCYTKIVFLKTFFIKLVLFNSGQLNGLKICIYRSWIPANKLSYANSLWSLSKTIVAHVQATSCLRM